MTEQYHGLWSDINKLQPKASDEREKTFYYGRGSQACLAVKIKPGFRAQVFVGSGKTLEKGQCLTIARDELYRLSDFFKALWIEMGQDIFVEPLIDDPHDEVFIHNFDFRQHE